MRVRDISKRTQIPIYIAGLLVVACLVILVVPIPFPALAFGEDLVERTSLCGVLLTAAIVTGSVPQLWSLAETSRSAQYSQLDNMYLELLRMAIENPRLRAPHELTSDQSHQYGSYAFAVWNFLEAVRDHCAEDQSLKDIWAPVIATEFEIHHEWFYKETTPYWNKEAPKFRLEFADFVWRISSPDGYLCGNVLHPDKAGWITDPWNLRTLDEIKAEPVNPDYLGIPEQCPGTGIPSELEAH